MEERERNRTGIASLKVRYNRVFGYYIEISKSNLHAVPPDYHRKQTIAGGERFITPALKEYEEKVLGADERILERELEIFETLRRAVAAEAPRIQATARARSRRSTCSPRWPKTPPSTTTSSRTSTTATRCTSPMRRHPGGRAAHLVGRRAVRAERHRRSTAPTLPAGDPDRAEHGRQVDLSAADRAVVRDGAGGLVRAGARSEDAAGRSHLRARRRVRQHRPRPFDVHGRDAGDRATSCTPPRRAASSCSTRSAAARRRSTA